MKVTFHGVRGSVPTPGPTTVRYGGNTVCVEVRLADDSLLVLDAGTGIRELGRQLVRGPLPDPIHMLVTHGHWDHIIGAPFFAPIWRKDAHVLVHAFTQLAYERFGKRVLFDGEHFPVRASDIPARVERAPLVGEVLHIGSATVRRIPLNHPGGADGFRIDDVDGASMCYLTDNELSPPGLVTTTPTELARFAKDIGLLIHDAQYVPSDMPAKHGWGHSLIDEVLELGRSSEARMLALHHHDPERDDHALDQIALHSRDWAAANAPRMTSIVASEGLTIDVLPR